MSQQPVQLELPDELYERIQQVAEESNRSLESVLVESLQLLFSQPSLSNDLTANLAELVNYSDEQLWAIVHRRLPWSDSMRLRELIAQSKQTALADSEKRELEYLLELVDRSMLLRSEALLRLKERGRDVERYLKRPARTGHQTRTGALRILPDRAGHCD
jgi:hypothetical protein